MKRKILLTLVCVLGLTLILATSAFAVYIDFASTGGDGLISFSGGNFTFTPSLSDGSDFTITHSGPADTLHDFTGNIDGTYAIGTIGAGGLGEIAPVSLSSGTNTFTINDGSTPFTASVDWVDISTSSNGTVGGLNYNALFNLTNFNYAGTNAELLDLLSYDTAAVTLSWQFASTGKDLYALKAATTPIVTSYSGSISTVPIPPDALLFGSGLLGLLVLRRRNPFKA